MFYSNALRHNTIFIRGVQIKTIKSSCGNAPNRNYCTFSKPPQPLILEDNQTCRESRYRKENVFLQTFRFSSMPSIITCLLKGPGNCVFGEQNRLATVCRIRALSSGSLSKSIAIIIISASRYHRAFPVLIVKVVILVRCLIARPIYAFQKTTQ